MKLQNNGPSRVVTAFIGSYSYISVRNHYILYSDHCRCLNKRHSSDGVAGCCWFIYLKGNCLSSGLSCHCFLFGCFLTSGMPLPAVRVFPHITHICVRWYVAFVTKTQHRGDRADCYIVPLDSHIRKPDGAPWLEKS